MQQRPPDGRHPAQLATRAWRSISVLEDPPPPWPPEGPLEAPSLTGVTSAVGADTRRPSRLRVYARGALVGVVQPDICIDRRRVGGPARNGGARQLGVSIAPHTPFIDRPRSRTCNIMAAMRRSPTSRHEAEPHMENVTRQAGSRAGARSRVPDRSRHGIRSDTSYLKRYGSWTMRKRLDLAASTVLVDSQGRRSCRQGRKTNAARHALQGASPSLDSGTPRS